MLGGRLPQGLALFSAIDHQIEQPANLPQSLHDVAQFELVPELFIEEPIINLKGAFGEILSAHSRFDHLGADHGADQGIADAFAAERIDQ